MTTMLMTGIGGDIAQGVARIVGESFPDWRLIGSDAQDRHAGRRYVGATRKSPLATEPGYLDWLLETLGEFSVDVLAPLTEPELKVISGVRDRLPSSTTLIYAGAAALEVGLDKLRTAEFLIDIGLPTPWTKTSIAEVNTGQWPCIYKPRQGSGSRSVFLCDNEQDGYFFARKFPGGIFQELLLPAESEVTCGVFRSRAGRTLVLPMLRKLAGGMTGWAKVIRDEQIEKQCRTIADRLKLAGSINVQLRITAEGPRIFEINPRFSSTSLMRHRIGFQDVLWSLKDALDLPFEPDLPEAGLTMVRTFDAHVLS